MDSQLRLKTSSMSGSEQTHRTWTTSQKYLRVNFAVILKTHIGRKKREISRNFVVQMRVSHSESSLLRQASNSGTPKQHSKIWEAIPLSMLLVVLVELSNWVELVSLYLNWRKSPASLTISDQAGKFLYLWQLTLQARMVNLPSLTRSTLWDLEISMKPRLLKLDHF